MRKFFAVFAVFSLLVFASIAFADDPAPVMKKTGTENAMMKGKGKKLGLKKNAAKTMMKKNAKKGKKMKKMEKKTETTVAPPTTPGTGTGTGTGTETTPPASTTDTPSPAAPATSTAQTATVNIQNFSFATSTVNVKVGDSVKWTNLDSTGHTVESNDGTTFKSGTLVINDTFSKTFSAAGTFQYHCGPHPSMTGTVVVSQ